MNPFPAADLTNEQYSAALTDHGFIAVPMPGFVALTNGTLLRESDGGASNRERLAWLIEQKHSINRPVQPVAVAVSSAMLPGSLTSRALLALVAPPFARVPAMTVDFAALDANAAAELHVAFGPQTFDEAGRDHFEAARSAQLAFWAALGKLEMHLDIEIDGASDLSDKRYETLRDGEEDDEYEGGELSEIEDDGDDEEPSYYLDENRKLRSTADDGEQDQDRDDDEEEAKEAKQPLADPRIHSLSSCY